MFTRVVGGGEPTPPALALAAATALSAVATFAALIRRNGLPLLAWPRAAWQDTPGPGRWSYRVGLSANWLNDRTKGDVLLLSEPVTVTVR